MEKILEFLRKCYKYLKKTDRTVLNYSVSKQKKILESFEDPQNDLERSYYQYCCQMKLNNPIIFLIMNVLSIFLIPVYYIKKSDLLNKEKYQIIFLIDQTREDILPKELLKEKSSVVYKKLLKEYFSKDDKKFFIELVKKYPFSWHFLLKILIKLRKYSYQINSCLPKKIVVSSEYSFTSSILTEYCKNYEIEHINIMHGEKLYDITDSFFHFSKCYVWDKHYIELFKKLRAENNQFIISVPPALILKLDENVEKVIDYTYYLMAESRDELSRIAQCMNILKNRGYEVSVRPHPIYSNIKDIKKIFRGIEIENNNKIDIKSSILRTKNAISLYSTVLTQAYNSGINIIIDDISNYKGYKELFNLEFIVFTFKYKLLSNEIKKGN